MKTKVYQRPTMKVVQLQQRGFLMSSYTMTTTGGRNQLTDGADDISDWNE